MNLNTAPTKALLHILGSPFQDPKFTTEHIQNNENKSYFFINIFYLTNQLMFAIPKIAIIIVCSINVLKNLFKLMVWVSHSLECSDTHSWNHQVNSTALWLGRNEADAAGHRPTADRVTEDEARVVRAAGTQSDGQCSGSQSPAAREELVHHGAGHHQGKVEGTVQLQLYFRIIQGCLWSKLQFG